jgi:hypothetical protein
MFKRFKAWAVAAGAIILAVLGAIALVIRQARRDGINQVLTEQQERRDDLRKHYDEIDGRPPDFGGAVDRLRERANRKR